MISDRDFKPDHYQPRRHGGWLALTLTVAVTALVATALPEQADATRAATANPSQPSTTVRLPLALPSVETEGTPSIAQAEPEATEWRTIEVKRGDNLGAIFKRAGVDLATMYRIVNLSKEVEQTLASIHPGDQILFDTNADNQLAQLSYEYSDTRRLLVKRNPSGNLVSEEHVLALDTRSQAVSATISDSLYLSAKRAGLDDNLIMELANIFGWDVDFALDIRQGDHFLVIYEELYRDGERLGTGNILAAEFTNQGKSYRAIRYTDGHYYTPDGNSMRKAFLRSPVDFRRISSKFRKERWHPVLGKKRPHRGVDYAAATGTPIKASGDGKIIFRGKKSGYGNTVIIQHGNSYTTLYAHLSKFRKGKGQGNRVKQGEVIGYVGMSGLATGPHLHYEFRVNGVHRNPLTVKLPDAQPINPKQMAAFLQLAEPLTAQLDSYKRILVARND